jgi:hypothetical protein
MGDATMLIAGEQTRVSGSIVRGWERRRVLAALIVHVPRSCRRAIGQGS